MPNEKRRARPPRTELKTTKVFAVGSNKYPENLSEVHYDLVDAKQAAAESDLKVFQCRIHIGKEMT